MKHLRIVASAIGLPVLLALAACGGGGGGSATPAFVPTAGGGNMKVSGALGVAGQIERFFWARDSSLIAYTADQDTDNVEELYASRPDGTGNLKLSGPLVAGPGGGVSDFQMVR